MVQRVNFSHRMRARVSDETGSTTLEASIMAVAILLFFAGFLHFAMLGTANNQATSAATAGYNAARLYNADTASARSAALNIATGGAGPLADATVTVSRGVNDVTVTVTGTTPSFVPGLSTGVTQTVSGPVERVVG